VAGFGEFTERRPAGGIRGQFRGETSPNARAGMLEMSFLLNEDGYNLRIYYPRVTGEAGEEIM
jgi:hypothetical protein